MPPKRSNSSKADRVRTALFPVLASAEGGVKELHLGWKYADNRVGFWSNSPKSSKSRPAWGNVIGCQFKNTKNDQGEYGDYLVFQNRREKKAFKVKEINPALWEMNLFTQKLIDMKKEGRFELMALYLSLLVKAKTFSQNQEGVHTEDGFRLDGTDVKLEDIVKKGGSLEELRGFVENAAKCCMNVSGLKEVMEKVEGGKRKEKI